jgi:hypothetical protein
VADRSSAGRRRPGRARVAVVSSLIPTLAVAVVAGGRQPGSALLATSITQPGAAGPVLPPAGVPDGFHRPGERAMRSPASVSRLTPRLAQTSIRDVPDVALAAYQQAAAVIDTADLSCHLDWTLLAAVGQVESDHGRVGGSRLDRHGVATPRIIGPRLDGRHGTTLVRDTDAGRLDGDRRYDHAVGPMQFLPSTWAVVAVDADGDGRRNVQDVNDAALGSAVYLCAGHDDLSGRAGQRAALFRYNHSASYVATVLAIAHGLQTSGLFAPVTSRTIPAVAPTVPQAHHPTDGHTTSAEPPPIVVTDPVPPTVPPSTATPGPSEDPSPTPSPSPSGSPGPSPTATTVPSSTAHPIPLPTRPTTSATPTPSDPTTSPTEPTPSPTTSPTEPTPSGSPTVVPEPPVIPDPLPPRLADLTPAQVDAFDAAWPACAAELPDPWTRRDVRRILAGQLDLSRHDPALREFARWVDRHEHRASEPTD